MDKSAQDRKLRQILEVFFGNENEKEPQTSEEAERYVKMRIRSVMEILIEEEDTQKMEILEKRGWIGERELESYIRTAREEEKPAALMWLLHLKNRKYGYHQEKFDLF